jgi:hypothetical protein
MDGEFGIGGGHFTNPKVQEPVNRLAESARGETKAQEDVDTATVLSNLKGHLSANGGIAQLSKVSFTEPGTIAEIEGTYNLIDKKVNLRGVLHTSGKLADTTSGFKSLVLKALGPFIKKKSVTVVPFVITGTSSDPSFALDLDAKRSPCRRNGRATRASARSSPATGCLGSVGTSSWLKTPRAKVTLRERSVAKIG